MPRPCRPSSGTCAPGVSATRPTNRLERLFVEERRRTKIVPDAFGERPVLKLVSGAMTRIAERWRSIRFTELERRRIEIVRREPDAECETADTASPAPRQARPASGISSGSRT